MTIADNGKHPWESGNFLRRSLSIAAGDKDANPGIGTLNAANVGAGVAIRLGCDRAGVDDEDIRAQTVGGSGAQGFQTRGNRISVGLAGAAAEALHVVSCHLASVTIA